MIRVDHNYCTLDSFDMNIYKLLTWESKAFVGKGANKKFKITQHSMLNTNYKFLTGLLPRVLESFPQPIKDTREFFKLELSVPELADELREYQLNYLIEALKLTRCLVKCPTGGGKTLLMAALIGALRLPTLIIAPSIDIKNQLFEELSRLLGKNYHISTDSNDMSDVLINLPGTLKNSSDDILRAYSVLLMDEAHGAAASQCTDVILRNDAAYRFGFTATPTGRSDGRDLWTEGLFGKIIEIVDHTELVEQGFLPETQIDIYSCSFDGNYAYMEELLIVNNTKRNDLIAQIVNDHTRQKKGEVALVLVRRVEHGKILSDLIPDAVYIDGSTPPDIRTQVKEDAKKGNIKAIIATAIFAQGIDIPQITLGINAAGGKSDILTAQRFGRVTRPFGENVKHWIDLFDSYTKTLEGHSKERLNIYSDKTKKIRLKNFSDEKKRSLQFDYNL